MAAPNVSYFRPAPASFWEWRDDVNVIEGIGGYTICYREDLIPILREMAPNGLPSLSNILVCLTACYADTSPDAKMEKSITILVNLPGMTKTMEQLHLQEYGRQAIALIGIISGLPAEWRTGAGRVHLLNELFSDSKSKIPTREALSIVDEFSGGHYDYLMMIDHHKTLKPQIGITDADVIELQNIVRTCTDRKRLELKLKTGYTEVPRQLPLEIITEKENSEKTLMEELLEDDRTSALAQLTQRLIAALNIPMHAANASDHSYGGISDISNRGNFDRLLLSELANDDLSLMARLVNNEALYLRREAPPVNFDRHRNLLIDTTIKMWGMPRFFSVAAALACAQNHHHTASVEAYALGRDEHTAIDLGSKDGVIDALQHMDPALDSWPALLSFVARQEPQANTENILIAGDDFFDSPVYYIAHDEIQRQLHFLITVNRKGDVQFYEFLNGRRKLISAAKFDIDDITKAKKIKPTIPSRSGRLPAFYEQYPYPLFFPTMNMKGGSRFIFRSKDGLVGVNEQRRLLYWRSASKGARQLLPAIAAGEICFGAANKRKAYILAYNDGADQALNLYTLDLVEETATVNSIPHSFGYIVKAIYHRDMFYLNTKDQGRKCLDAGSGLFSDQNISSSDFDAFNSNYVREYMYPGGARKFINNGYGVFQKIGNASVGKDGGLMVGGYSLSISPGKEFRFTTLSMAHRQSPVSRAGDVEIYTDESLPHVRFSKVTWKDGSTLILDTYGLIHLQSSDRSMPAITFPSILDKPLACWSSDGHVAGSTYFHNGISEAQMGTSEFYETYIQRFIDHIIAQCS